ncbi:receptor-type tyrosine-protein phosphatase S-like [Amphiura filiformis]|uniref:receptor-type tyrosine-protein phosphatase S-like n=1 Tax=Amphiura filiformis TaxID=82378 RepID=UPI003B20E2F9
MSILNLNLGGGAWCPVSVRPENTGGYEYLEINLINMTMITAVSIQGRWNYGLGREYVRKFRLEYTTNDGRWMKYTDQSLETVFDGNTDTQTIKTVDLSPAMIATKVRIVPVVEMVTTVCMRVELFGCLWKDPPVITQELRDESGLEDHPIAFICKASGHPAPTFEWMKGNSKTSNTRYTIMPILNGSILWIEPLRTRDNSQYSCVATNSEGSATTSANLHVFPSSSIPRSFPEITVSPRLTVVEKHRQAVMSCAATGTPDPEILWLVNMLPVDTSSDRIHISDTFTLTIDNADESDQGSYQCAASNSAGTRYSYSANLYVRERRVPPTFTIEPVNMEVVPGGSVNLTCVAEGNPIPMVKWTHGGMDLTTGELPIGRNVLQLTNIEETGEYTCVAMSSLGTIQTSVTVTVRSELFYQSNRPMAQDVI